MKKFATFCSLFIAFITFSPASHLSAQIISTIAGCGVGDDSLATLAELFNPSAVKADKQGNIYIADVENQRIRKVDANGIITTFAGTGIQGYNGDNQPATAAQLNIPSGIAIDKYGNILIAEQGSARIRKVDASGIITTIAGTGVAGYSGDNGPATAAQLVPSYIDVDTANNIYFTDYGHEVIRKINASGIITTYAGNGTMGFMGDGGPATSAELYGPFSIATDRAGNVYFGDYGNFRLRKISTLGVITTIAGDGTYGYSGDGGPATSAATKAPTGVVVDTAGNIYFSDNHNYCIRKINTSGIINTVIGNGTPGMGGDGGPALQSMLNTPFGLALDTSQNLYIADTWNNRVRKVNTANVISTLAGRNGIFGDYTTATNAEFSEPYNVVADNAGNVYVADVYNNRIRKIDANGAVSTFAGTGIAGYGCGFSGDGGPATAAAIYYPFSMVLDNAGNMYIADTYNQRVRKVDASGIISTVAGNGLSGFGGDGIAATSAQLRYPDDVAIDNAGNLYIADGNNYRVRKVNPAGIIHTVAGTGTIGYSGDGGPGNLAKISYPADICVDRSGNLYISDGYNNRVRKVDTFGIITTFAGTGTSGYSGDGGLATNAQIYNPGGLRADSAGNIYLCDYGNNCIRKIDINGIITTIAGNGIWGYSGDGGLAINSSFNGPDGFAINDAGTMYVADGYNYRIRKITSTLSVPGINKQDIFAVYPNPATTQLTITGPINNIALFNTLGQQVYTSQYTHTTKTTINISHLPPGVYLIKVNDTHIQKIIKQ